MSSREMNIQIMTWRENRRKGDRECSIARRTGVIQMDMDGTTITEYASVAEAREKTGACNIVSCCQGDSRQSGGFRWRYSGKSFRTLKDRKEIGIAK